MAAPTTGYSLASAPALIDQRDDLIYVPPGPPEEAPEVESSGITHDTLSFTWGAVQANPEVAAYTATLQAGGVEVQASTSPDALATFEGLDTDTEYTLEVFATNDLGDGPAGTFTVSTTPAEPPAPPEVTMVVTPGRIDVSWPTWVPGAEDYVVRLLTLAGETIESQITEAWEAHFEASPSTRYLVRVTSRNEFGEGEPWEGVAETPYPQVGSSVLLNFTSTPIVDAIVGEPDPNNGLAGAVQDIHGDPLANHRVHIHDRNSGELVRRVDTDETGRWEWRGAMPGEYYVVAINPSVDAADYAPPAANRLTPVILEQPQE